jgi:hypothetical protein
MIERSLEQFYLYPGKLMGDSAYGSAEMLGWLVYKHGTIASSQVAPSSVRPGTRRRAPAIANMSRSSSTIQASRRRSTLRW